MTIKEMKNLIKEILRTAEEEGWDDADLLEYLETQGIKEELEEKLKELKK